MRYLLDKVTARFIIQALSKLAGLRTPTVDEKIALDFFLGSTP